MNPSLPPAANADGKAAPLHLSSWAAQQCRAVYHFLATMIRPSWRTPSSTPPLPLHEPWAQGSFVSWSWLCRRPTTSSATATSKRAISALASAATVASASTFAATLASAVAVASRSCVCVALWHPPRPPPPWLSPWLALASAASLASVSDARSSRAPRRTFARPRLPPSPEPLPRHAFGAVASPQPPSSSQLRATRRRRREDVGSATPGNTAGSCSAAKRRRTHLSAGSFDLQYSISGSAQPTKVSRL